MTSAFAALADPIRRQIVEMLGSGECSAGDLARQFPVSQPAISHHLRILREAHLVHVRIHGQQRLYSLSPIGFSGLADWLAHMESFWMARVNRLEQNLRSRPSPQRSARRKRGARKRSRR